ncbi:hypothetical protein [Devosia psychrophila]|uniref:Uncharacterized protein n=1 Tax=Devosia psychrophila TaxID=728005 RepID=A0A1I1GFD3_9HYPH|nr:hypothetical protein [Devosia psychrophila]SFC10166.1 hypothetical protein SAMN04488059_102135 [Devosia psychrophila]
MRVPQINPAQASRDKLIAKLERDLKALQKIPPHQREAELADVRQEAAALLLAETRK